jgi:hypothetical protein
MLLSDQGKRVKETKVRNATSGPNGPIFSVRLDGEKVLILCYVCMCPWGRWRGVNRERGRGEVRCGVGSDSEVEVEKGALLRMD